MKINTVLMVLLLVLFCCGGLAQKPQKMTRNNPEYPITVHSNFNPDIPHRVKDESVHPLRRLLDDGSHKPDLTCLNNHLKSEPATSSPVEKLDSIRDYHYNPDSSKWFPEDGDYYIYDIQGRNYSIWTGWYDIQKNAIVPENKTELILTSGGMISGFIFSSWIDASQYWRPDNKYEFNFDANGNSISGSTFTWNEFTKSWNYNQTDTTTYTGTGNILSRIFYQYIFDGDFWDPNNKEEYTYDGKDFLVQKNTYNWYYDAGWRWENSSETRYFNDDQGRDTSRIEYQWDILNWYESSKVSKRYDANGNKTYQEDFYWDGEVWQGSWRAIYNYDANNNLVLEESYYWNGEMREWYGSWKTVDTYNAGNRLIQSVDFQWDNIKMDWYMYVKDVNIWDASGNLIEQINSSYDTANQVFNPGQKEVYGYDMSKLMIDIAMPYYLSEESEIGESHVNKVVSKTVLSWNPQLLRYDTSYVDSLYYSGLFDAPVNDANCKADFDWRLDGNDDFLVHLTDMSDTTVVSWYWMFGDGKTSTQQNPRHLFDKPGTFRVILTTSDKSGFCNNTLVKQIKVGNPACNAAFDFTVNIENHAVTLINNSGGSNLQYYWSFGDGSVSKDKNPVLQYQHPGSYEITLTVSNSGNCMDRFSAKLSVGSLVCNADFVVYVDSSSNTVYFRARQKFPENSYHWVFGDGTVANTPTHVQKFSHPGYYSAVLTVSNKKAGCLESRKENILVGKKSPVGEASFIYVSGEDNKVAFTNQSLGQELSYFWDFNDGSDPSKDKDAVHSYALPGYYNVCLTVNTKDGLQNTHCEKIFAGTDTKDQCLARFEYSLSRDGLEIACVDRSLGNPDQWKWTYNEGGATTDKDPKWSTNTPAYVRIHQTIFNSANGCQDDAFGLVNMGAKSKLKAGFGYTIKKDNKKADSYPVDFVGVSLGDAGKLKWSFGDGTYDSTTINPTHIYPEPGTYEACLTIINTATGQEDMDCQIINVHAVFINERSGSANVGLNAYPNPFRESTRIDIRLKENSTFDLSVYDLMGRKVKTIVRDQRPAGVHTFSLNGLELERGNYYLILETEAGTARQVISIIR